MRAEALNSAAFLNDDNDGVHTATCNSSGIVAEAIQLIANCDAAERPFELNMHWPPRITTPNSKLAVIKEESSHGVLMMSIRFAASGLRSRLLAGAASRLLFCQYQIANNRWRITMAVARLIIPTA